MQDELKPCPFCGCQKLSLNVGVLRYVSCPDCYTEGPWNEESEEEAITAWNTRTGKLIVVDHPPTTTPVDERETPVGDHQMVDRRLVEAIINDYHTTRLDSDHISHILGKPRTIAALTAARAQVEGEIAEWLRSQRVDVPAHGWEFANTIAAGEHRKDAP